MIQAQKRAGTLEDAEPDSRSNVIKPGDEEYQTEPTETTGEPLFCFLIEMPKWDKLSGKYATISIPGRNVIN